MKCFAAWGGGGMSFVINGRDSQDYKLRVFQHSREGPKDSCKVVLDLGPSLVCPTLVT